MTVVIRFALERPGALTLDVPTSASVLSVGFKAEGTLHSWWRVDGGFETEPKKVVRLYVALTGEAFDGGEYIGTAVSPLDDFVAHVFLRSGGR